MPALKSYIRGFSRTPEDARDYITKTNAVLASAFADFGVDENNVVQVQWVPFNQYVWCIITYHQ